MNSHLPQKKQSLSNSLSQRPVLRNALMTLGGLAVILSVMFGVQLTDPEVEISLVSGDNYITSSNSNKIGPEAGYISFEVCNTSVETLTGLSARLDNFSSSGYKLAGGQVNDQSIEELAPGECKILYWYTEYPRSSAGSTYSATINVYQNDDPSAIIGTEDAQFNVRGSLSAAAGGHMEEAVVGGGDVLGSLVEFEVEYSFGNIKEGTELIFQPSGNTDFDAACFQLVGTEIMKSDLESVPVGDQGKFFYVAQETLRGTDQRVRVKYYFKNACIGAGTEPKPYAAMVSGNNFKYSDNFGTAEFQTAYAPASYELNVVNTASSYSAHKGDLVTYKVEIINESEEVVSLDNIENELPDNFTFESMISTSEINSTNTFDSPESGDAGMIEFTPQPSEVYPHTSFMIEPGDTLTLLYDARVPSNSYEGDFTNTAYAVVGTTKSEGSSMLCVGDYPCTLPVSWNAFEVSQQGPTSLLQWEINDEGTGAYFEVERSIDGNVFENIGKMNTRKSLSNEHYSFQDKSLYETQSKKVFYRVKHVDVNGISLHSEVVNLLVNESPLTIQIAPNPVQENVNINYVSASDENVSLRIYSSTGMSRFVTSAAGGGSFDQSIYVKDWPTGIYYVEIISGDDKTVKSFLKN